MGIKVMFGLFEFFKKIPIVWGLPEIFTDIA